MPSTVITAVSDNVIVSCEVLGSTITVVTKHNAIVSCEVFGTTHSFNRFKLD